MKKILGLLIVLALTLPCLGMAEGIDLSSMSTNDLLLLREQINTEITLRSAKDQEKVILFEDSDGLTIYLSGKVNVKEGKSLALEYVVVNNGKTEKSCYYYTEAVNGWESRKWKTMTKGLVPGRKAKDTITFYDEEYIDSYDEPIVLEFELFDGESAFDKGASMGKFKVLYNQGIISLVDE